MQSGNLYLKIHAHSNIAAGVREEKNPHILCRFGLSHAVSSSSEVQPSSTYNSSDNLPGGACPIKTNLVLLSTSKFAYFNFTNSLKIRWRCRYQMSRKKLRTIQIGNNSILPRELLGLFYNASPQRKITDRKKFELIYSLPQHDDPRTVTRFTFCSTLKPKYK